MLKYDLTDGSCGIILHSYGVEDKRPWADWQDLQQTDHFGANRVSWWKTVFLVSVRMWRRARNLRHFGEKTARRSHAVLARN